jgi:hypothetical protein
MIGFPAWSHGLDQPIILWCTRTTIEAVSKKKGNQRLSAILSHLTDPADDAFPASHL